MAMGFDLQREDSIPYICRSRIPRFRTNINSQSITLLHKFLELPKARRSNFHTIATIPDFLPLKNAHACASRSRAAASACGSSSARRKACGRGNVHPGAPQKVAQLAYQPAVLSSFLFGPMAMSLLYSLHTLAHPYGYMHTFLRVANTFVALWANRPLQIALDMYLTASAFPKHVGNPWECSGTFAGNVWKP